MPHGGHVYPRRYVGSRQVLVDHLEEQFTSTIVTPLGVRLEAQDVRAGNVVDMVVVSVIEYDLHVLVEPVDTKDDTVVGRHDALVVVLVDLPIVKQVTIEVKDMKKPLTRVPLDVLDHRPTLHDVEELTATTNPDHLDTET